VILLSMENFFLSFLAPHWYIMIKYGGKIMNNTEERKPDAEANECMCAKPFEAENARANDEDAPCKNGES